MYKILATCGNGMGSSLLMEMKVKQIFQSHGFDFEIEHCSLGEAKTIAGQFDIIFCPESFKESLNSVPERTKLIPLQNVMSSEEIEKKMRGTSNLLTCSCRIAAAKDYFSCRGAKIP